MKFSTKVLLSILGLAALVVLVWQGYLTVRYRLHNGHRDVISMHRSLSEGYQSRSFEPLQIGAGDIDGMELAAESAELRLYVDETNGNIALFDKRDGNITYAVHPDMAEDPRSSDLNRSSIQSQVTVDFFTPNRTPVYWNSFDHSVKLGQFKIETLDGIGADGETTPHAGLRVTYTIGDISSPTGIVPVYISRERLEQVLAPLEGTRDYNNNLRRYVESDVAPGYMELGTTLRTGSRTYNEMNEVFASVGYTAEDYAADMAGSGVPDAVPLHFVVPLDFYLDDDSLIVNINTADIGEYSDGRIGYIQIMRGFGAGGLDEEGYFVVPNGSGSLIYFNNGKTYADEYIQYIYGEDPMLRDYLTLGNIEPARLPYFGIEAGTRTVLGRVEAGESQAYILAGISEKFGSYNYIYPGFVLRGSLSLEMFGTTGIESSLPVVERDMPEIDLTVRYTMLPGGSGYSGMASRAREQLIEEGVLAGEVNAGGDIPFYMDHIGSAMGQKFFAGVRYMGQIPMTTYSQASEIYQDLRDEHGISNQVINYQGWFNRGYYHDVVNRINPVRQLGNTKELEALAGVVEDGGGRLYSDVNMLGIPYSSKRYNWQMESSRYYAGGMVGYWGLVNPITYYNTFSLGYSEVMRDALSPRFIGRYMDSYIKEISKYDLTGTSLRDMGDMLVSDRRRTDVIHREQAKEVIVHNIEKLRAQGRPIMVSGGNMYALGFADDIINMPLSHNALYVVDEEIPFVQMLLHGRVSYAGTPINLSSDFDLDRLIIRLVEYGASPHFAFTYEASGDVKYTGLNWMYSTRYDNWSARAAEIYHAVNEALAPVRGADMESHEILDNRLRVTTYSNGVQIAVNRTNAPIDHNGQTIPAVGYIVIGETK